MAVPLETCAFEEQRAVITKRCKTSEICRRRMGAQYGSNCMIKRNVYRWVKGLEDGCTTTKDERRFGRSKDASVSTIVTVVERLIWSDRRFTIE